MQSLTLALVAVVALAASCRSSGGGESPFRELEFQVDSTLLGKPVYSYGLVLCAPSGWEEADTALMAAVRNGLAEQAAGNVLPEFDGVYLHGESGAVLVVTSFAGSPGPSGDFAGWARSFVEGYRATNPEVPVEEDWLKIGGVPSVQLYQADSVRIHFKYLLRGDRVIGLDYSVPRAAWPDEVRAVESSVGSVRKAESRKQKAEILDAR